MEEWLEYEVFLLSFNTAETTEQDIAEQQCQNMGARLVAITSPGMEHFVDKIIDDRNITEHPSCVWLGLRNDTGEWLWHSRERLTYHNWERNEPNFLDSQKCVSKHITGPYKAIKTWFNEYCESGPSCGRICQKPNLPTLPPLILRTTSEMNTTGENIIVTDVNTFPSIDLTTPEADLNADNSLLYAIIFPVLLLVILLIVGLVFYLRWRKRKRQGNRITTEHNNKVEVHEDGNTPEDL